MSLNFLKRFFRICGHNPCNSRTDKCIAFVCVCLVLTTTGALHNLPSLMNPGVTSFTHVGPSLSTLLCNLGSITTANTGKVSFATLANDVGLVSDVRATLCGLIMYLCVCVNASLALLDGFRLPTTCRRVVVFTFSHVALFQQILLIRSLKKQFSKLNSQLIYLFDRESRGYSIPKTELEIILHEHCHLRWIGRKISSFFSIYNIFFIMFHLLYMIKSLLVFIDTFENPSKVATYYALGGKFLFTTPKLLLWFYCVEECMKEANLSLQILHENLQVNSQEEIMELVNSKEKIMELVERFSLAHVNNAVAFSAGGLFTICNGLFTKIVGLALTYFVILLQLKES